MANDKKNNLIAFILSTVGFLFSLLYIFKASSDVVSSDYIRVINSYIVDVTDLKYLLSWEGISRMPFAFLARFINVTFFKYSVNFDRILGILGLFLFNFITVKFVLNTLCDKVLKCVFSIIITFVSFSLISWEMILNGTGYPHFIMTGIIATTFYLFDKVTRCEKVPAFALHISLYLIIAIGSLCFGGPYSVSYLCTLSLFSAIELLTFTLLKDNYKYKKLSPFIIVIALSIICLLCYLKSNNTGEALVPVGFTDISLPELLISNPKFIIKFLLKSFASCIVGVETLKYALEAGQITEKSIYMLGFAYLLTAIVALFIVINKIVQKNASKKFTFDINLYGSTMPLMYVVCGTANFLLIFLSRYKFVRDDYGMSSRYGIQYMFLSVGILIILATYLDEFIASRRSVSAIYSSNSKFFLSKSGKILCSAIAILCIISISTLILGHGITAKDEIHKAQYRKAIYEDRIEKAKAFETLSDKELESSFEFRRGPDQIRSAFSTLKKQHLNIFKE